jgi:hypothetical protein
LTCVALYNECIQNVTHFSSDALMNEHRAAERAIFFG